MQASDVRTVKVTPRHFTGLCYISGQVDDFIRSGFGECAAPVRVEKNRLEKCNATLKSAEVLL